MAQGTFVQALRKEAALGGTVMNGRARQLQRAVRWIVDTGARVAKNL